MRVIAYCQQCGHQHGIDFNPLVPTNEFADWQTKHLNHSGVGFDWPQRSSKPAWITEIQRFWGFIKKGFAGRPGIGVRALCDPYQPAPAALAAFLHNANVKLSYVASSALTFTSITSLASSSTKLAGAESAAVSNASNLYLDYNLAGIITVGTTPTTAKSIDVCVVGIANDTTWPDVFDGTDSAETVTNQEIKDQICKPFATISIISTTSNVGYWFGPGSVASRFGGVVPVQWDVFVTHDSVAALNGTGGNHVLSITPSYITVV